MSYILDALKQADAERQRGAVPGLHAQQVSRPADSAGHQVRTRWWTVGVLGLVLVGAALGYRGIGAPAPLAVAPQVILPPVVPPRVELPLATAKPVAQVKPLPKIEAFVSKPAETPKIGELPEDIRKQIPALTINGSVYSDNPAQRMLVVNNLVQTQGSQITPDLKLEEIGSKSSVFSFAGTRFRISH